MSHAFANVDRKTRGAERRIFRRRRVRSLAYVELGQGNGGIVLNVSEGGLAVQAVMAVTGDELPDMRLQLAHSNKEIRTKGRVTWTGEFRKLAGIEFVDLSVEALRQIREWIALEEPEERPAETTSRKTLEAIDSAIEFPPHLEMPEHSSWRLRSQRVRSSWRARFWFVDSGSSRMAARETKSQKEVSLPRRTFLSAQERASILGELKTEKEAVATAAEELSAEAPSTRSASSASMPSARSAVYETIPVESDTAKIEKRASEFAFPATAISALDETPPSASSPPADRYGFKLSTPSAKVAAPNGHKNTIVLVGAFAIVALGIGWMAGRAGLRGVLKNSESDERAASPAAAVVAAESPTITEIEVVDARNQRWLIPFQSPSGERAGATRFRSVRRKNRNFERERRIAGSRRFGFEEFRIFLTGFDDK